MGPTIALTFNAEDHELIQAIKDDGRANRPEDVVVALAGLHQITDQEALNRAYASWVRPAVLMD
jgi:hypothetical protein